MQKNSSISLTEGKLFPTLIKFALPIFFALLLQALYGGVDMLIIGRFATTNDVSGVATGAIVLQTITNFIVGLSMGVTVLVGQYIGQKRKEEAGKAVGTGIIIFALLSILLTLILTFGASTITTLMKAPLEAYAQTNAYIRICGIGSVFIVAYNLIGSIFRGMGDAKTPLITVAIACVVNIVGDLILIAGFKMGAAGAAIATVGAQGVSVILSLLLIQRKELPFSFQRKDIRIDKELIISELKIGAPLALQNFLLGISFVVIQMIVNTINMIASAGVGVAEKICMFIMLIPIAFMQTISSFTAQNLGAKQVDRAKRALRYGILSSLFLGSIMAFFAFFYGDLLSAVFTKDLAVIGASHNYLKAYAIDTLLVSFIFCYIGYFNGAGKTFFVLLQGLVGSIIIRIPAAYLISRIPGATLFHIGLANPISTAVQIVLCIIMYLKINHTYERSL
ncbi:MAG TPA: MATE family efflux transporter [Candidatus Dorea intestinavium]|nr:MATE family efflux transporter [Candidatus Dorea intestinavium]